MMFSISSFIIVAILTWLLPLFYTRYSLRCFLHHLNRFVFDLKEVGTLTRRFLFEVKRVYDLFFLKLSFRWVYWIGCTQSWGQLAQHFWSSGQTSSLSYRMVSIDFWQEPWFSIAVVDSVIVCWEWEQQTTVVSW
jgi:hypothetical protein